jgi:hypothetical protein
MYVHNVAKYNIRKKDNKSLGQLTSVVPIIKLERHRVLHMYICILETIQLADIFFKTRTE